MNKWIEISTDAIVNNLRAVKTQLGNRCRLIAVLKGNAYGHGAVETAHILRGHGVDFFAVSFAEEAIQLIEAGINTDILILTPVVDEFDTTSCLNEGVVLTLSSITEFRVMAKLIAGLDKSARVHLKIDSGLGRFGLAGHEALQICQEANLIPQIRIEGIYTHFADPGSSDYTAMQFRKFIDVTEELRKAGFNIPLRHVANSAVFLRSPEMYLDAVRIGTLLSGQHPVGNFPIRLELQDPFVFKSRIISLKTLSAGSFLGYYRTYKLKSEAQIAVIPVGFADGLALEVGNKPINFIDLVKKIVKMILGFLDWPGANLSVKVNGQDFPVRGKVFMQMTLIEVPLNYQVDLGDEVIVPVRKTLTASTVTRKYIQSMASQSVFHES